MNIGNRMVGCIGSLLIMAAVLCQGPVWAADSKVGVIDMKKVLSTSTAGAKAQGIIEQKMKTLQSSFKTEENELITLQKEIEKKSSAWSDAVKREKAVAFQKKRGELGAKQEEANVEMKKLREQHVNPILKKLEEIVEKVAQSEGLALVLPRNVVLFANDNIDISDKVTSELNKVMK